MNKIVVEYVNPPIPIRVYDWCAWIEGEQETGPWGYGKNEEAAVKDLLECLQDEEE